MFIKMPGFPARCWWNYEALSSKPKISRISVFEEEKPDYVTMMVGTMSQCLRNDAEAFATCKL